jgi:hypothetical protein
MRAGRSPGVRSGPKFSGWYVDAVNGSAGAGFARAAPEPPHRARGRSGVDSAFLHMPLRRLSVRRRGGKEPCCPRWAPNMVSPMSCKRVIRVDVRAPFVRGRLGAQRHAQKYLRVICRTRSPVTGSEGSMPPSDGIPLQDRSHWSRKCPRVPRERSPGLGYVSNVPMVIPRSASEAVVNPSGASLRTPDQ